MLNLEQSISDWRRQMLTAGIQTPEPLDELENHLRDELEQQMKLGLNAEAAFAVATKNIGLGNLLEAEFKKVGGMNKAQRRRIAGCFCAATLGFYVIAATWAMFKNDLSANEWWLGVTALAATPLSVYCLWQIAPRFFPIIACRRVQSAVGLVGGVMGAVWFVVFANFILPRFNFMTGQLVVTILWAMVPALALPTAAFLLLDKSEAKPAAPPV